MLKFALNRRIRSLGVTRKLDGGKIIGLWSEIVGPKVAERAHPESFSGGTLTIVVPDSAWRHQLSLNREELRARLNVAVGSNTVKDIYLVAVPRRKDL